MNENCLKVVRMTGMKALINRRYLSENNFLSGIH